MNNEAYERLYETCYMRVFSFAMTLTGDRHMAEEITQETFFQALTRMNSFRGESDEVTWLCAIAKNLFNDEKRKQGRFDEMPEDIATREKAVDQAAVERDDSFRVHKALHALEEPYREVFELRVFGELSFRQIGSIFTKTENWARVTFHRARAKLKERMDEE